MCKMKLPSTPVYDVWKSLICIVFVFSEFVGIVSNGMVSAQTSTVVLTDDWDTHNGTNGYWAINNTWGASPFQNGSDYKQSITIDTQNFPNNTVIDWTWPDKQSDFVVYGYPEIVWGPKGTWNGFPGSVPIPTKIKDLKELSAKFTVELEGNLAAVDILMESFLTDVASPTSETNDKFEISFLLYPSPALRGYEASQSRRYRFIGKFDANIAVVDGSPPIILIVPDTNIFIGTIDMLEVYRFLVANKIIAGDEYIRAVEFGVEPQGTVPGPHSGKLKIKTLNYTWQK
jgi:hypothetical protein